MFSFAERTKLVDKIDAFRDSIFQKKIFLPLIVNVSYDFQKGAFRWPPPMRPNRTREEMAMEGGGEGRL